MLLLLLLVTLLAQQHRKSQCSFITIPIKVSGLVFIGLGWIVWPSLNWTVWSMARFCDHQVLWQGSCDRPWGWECWEWGQLNPQPMNGGEGLLSRKWGLPLRGHDGVSKACLQFVCHHLGALRPWFLPCPLHYLLCTRTAFKVRRGLHTKFHCLISFTSLSHFPICEMGWLYLIQQNLMSYCIWHLLGTASLTLFMYQFI